MIIAHNVYKPFDLINQTVFYDNKCNLIKEIIISYNVDKPSLQSTKNITYAYHGPNKGWQSGAFNGFLSCCKQAKILGIKKLIFSHDDVFIDRPKLLEWYYNQLNNYNFITRKPLRVTIEKSSEYLMIDCCMLDEKAIDMFSSIDFKEEKDFFPLNSFSVEFTIGSLVKELKVLKVPYDSETYGQNELGFFHHHTERK